MTYIQKERCDSSLKRAWVPKQLEDIYFFEMENNDLLFLTPPLVTFAFLSVNFFLNLFHGKYLLNESIFVIIEPFTQDLQPLGKLS